MFEIARTCHDTLDVMSSEDDVRSVASLICTFIKQVRRHALLLLDEAGCHGRALPSLQIDFGRDLERQLEVFVDCRLSFPNIDQVKADLVRAAIALTLKALSFVKGRHSARTAAFVKSAYAFIAITIPGIDDPFARMVS
jgi:hypothetical protein